MKGVLIIISVLVFLPIVYAEELVSVPVAYCKHMGYGIRINAENRPDCYFDEHLKCDATEFYLGKCGSDKVKTIEPRKEGEVIYLEFERCENGLVPSEPKYLLEEIKCVKPSMWLRLLTQLFG